MRLNVEIDGNSGFCNGVVRAIRQAEDYLCTHDRLYSLGDIVHNSLELSRLKAKGLEILDIDAVSDLHDDTVLIRAHGEPPATYALAEANNLHLIDCTCPVVLALQRKVREVYDRMKDVRGEIIIFGKRGHAEVNGLVGQTDGNAVVVSGTDELDRIDFTRPIALFSQTTKDPQAYAALAEAIRSRSKDVQVFDTICRQVASRHKSLVEFARSHSVILFVSGRESSNGKVLFDLCKSANPRTFWLENASDMDMSWFHDGDSVGVCGATSTPAWQLEEVKDAITAPLRRC